MFRRTQRQIAQAGTDYVMVFFLVVAGTLTMTTYVTRALHGRHQMVRGFMYDQINALYQDTSLNLYGNMVRVYDPYYLDIQSEVRQDSSIEQSLQPGVFGGTVPIARKDYLRVETGTKALSNQLSPGFAD